MLRFSLIFLLLLSGTACAQETTDKQFEAPVADYVDLDSVLQDVQESVATLEQLAQMNKQAIEINTANIEKIDERLRKLESMPVTSSGYRVTVGKVAPRKITYTMPKPLAEAPKVEYQEPITEPQVIEVEEPAPVVVQYKRTSVPTASSYYRVAAPPVPLATGETIVSYSETPWMPVSGPTVAFPVTSSMISTSGPLLRSRSVTRTRSGIFGLGILGRNRQVSRTVSYGNPVSVPFAPVAGQAAYCVDAYGNQVPCNQ